MATHSSILAGKIPWTEELGGVWSMGLQRVRHTEHTIILRQPLMQQVQPIPVVRGPVTRKDTCTKGHSSGYIDVGVETTTWPLFLHVTPINQQTKTGNPVLTEMINSD